MERNTTSIHEGKNGRGLEHINYLFEKKGYPMDYHRLS